MEHTLREQFKSAQGVSRVLILVLVEHTLRAERRQGSTVLDAVLILVLVEHTLRGLRRRRV